MHNILKKIGLASEFFRFLIVGTLNFIFVYSLYFLLIWFSATYTVAFSISYVCGMVFAWLVNSLYSFSIRPRLSRLQPYALVATLNYLIGLLLIRWLVEEIMVSEALAPMIVIIALVPMSFLATRLTLLARLDRDSSGNSRD